jgi:hypothetical protein
MLPPFDLGLFALPLRFRASAARAMHGALQGSISGMKKELR